MRTTLNILGVILVIFGLIWFLQGINVLPGSFLTGEIRWAVYGAIAVASGAALLLAANRRRLDGPALDSTALIRFKISALLFTVTLARQRCFSAFLLARLQIERVPLDLLDDVLVHYFALKPLESAFQAFAFVELNFSQTHLFPKSERFKSSSIVANAWSMRTTRCDKQASRWRRLLSLRCFTVFQHPAVVYS